LRSSYSAANDIGYDDLFDRIRNVPLLVLDDLGVHSGSSWAKEKLDQLLSYRFNREMPTVVTVLDMNELDERLRTRLNDPGICHAFILDVNKMECAGYEWEEGLELQKQMTFENFDWKRVNLPLEQRENLERAYRLAMDYARSPDGWLVWQGVTGSGKTHLAAAIVNYLYQSGQRALFIVVPEFIDHLRSAFSPESRLSYDRVFERGKNGSFPGTR
jgi:DNA replication protein DnaC